ncbi:hypothetical protein BVRB_033190, partial [Beta vulgaris subsp. vulgaris]
NSGCCVGYTVLYHYVRVYHIRSWRLFSPAIFASVNQSHACFGSNICCGYVCSCSLRGLRVSWNQNDSHH